ncbi:MAG TPA: DUF1801 domain-containing protein [Candidatus Limnocylindria bacterium]|nr:DUF1801 domain-containing protein [Candidatus Limnocylindria bacterium]
MAGIKTKATKESVLKFLNSIKPDEKRKDALTLLKLFKKITGLKPVMWGTSIVGFGKYHYKSESSSQEGDWFLVGFSPRKQNLTLYILAWKKEDPKLLAKLGKYKRGGGCLYINRLADVNQKVLASLIKTIYLHRKKIHSKASVLSHME